jgi:hypothetical protein
MAKKKKEENTFQKSADELHNMINVLEIKDSMDIIPQLQIDEVKKDLVETDPIDKNALSMPPAGSQVSKSVMGGVKSVKSVPSFLQKSGDQLKPTKDNPLAINPLGQPGSKATVIEPQIKVQPASQSQNIAVAPPVGNESEAVPVQDAIQPAPPQFPEQSTGNIFSDIGIFMQELTQSFNQRYDMWENSTNLILSVLRKMQMINQENAEVLVVTLEELHEKTKHGLERFKIKRDAMEVYSDTNYGEVCVMLKKTLDLLALQLKEFKLKMLVNQITEIYSR